MANLVMVVVQRLAWGVCRTALHLAAGEGHYNICELLLKQSGVDPSALDRFGNSPL